MEQRTKGILQMMLTGVMWSFGGVLIKLTPWNPLVIAGVRSSIAALVMIAYMRRKKMRLELSRRTLIIAVCTFLTFVSFLFANKMTTAANAIVLQFTGPVYILIFSAVFFKTKVRRGDVLAVGVTLGGIALFFLDQLGKGSVLGDVLALASGVTFAGIFLSSNNVSEQTRMSGLLLGQFLTALVGLPLAFVYPTPLTATAVTCILVLGIFQLGIPYILYNLAAKHCPPLECAVFSVIEPLLNPVWVLLVTGERPSLWALVGAVIVLTTVTLWSVWGERKNQAERAALLSASE